MSSLSDSEVESVGLVGLIGSKTDSNQTFLWNNGYTTLVLLNYCYNNLMTEVETAKRRAEKGKTQSEGNWCRSSESE